MIFNSASRFYFHVTQLQTVNLRIKRIRYVMLCYVKVYLIYRVNVLKCTCMLVCLILGHFCTSDNYKSV